MTHGELAQELGFKDHEWDAFLTWADLHDRGITQSHPVTEGDLKFYREAMEQHKLNS